VFDEAPQAEDDLPAGDVFPEECPECRSCMFVFGDESICVNSIGDDETALSR
jgi:hypothetical protein